MGKTGLVFASLLPSDPYARNEIACIRKTIEGIQRYVPQQGSILSEIDPFIVVLGSAHVKTCEILQKEFGNINNLYIVHCPFRMEKNFSEIRAHEIGFSKRYLHQFILDRKLEHILYWIDSDMFVPVDQVFAYLNRMIHSSFIINFPYCLRGQIKAPPEQFGCYAINLSRLTPVIVGDIYQTARAKDGMIIRPGAPDCRIRAALIRDGAKEIRAEDIKCWHYNEDKTVYIYDNGGLSKQTWK